MKATLNTCVVCPVPGIWFRNMLCFGLQCFQFLSVPLKNVLQVDLWTLKRMWGGNAWRKEGEETVTCQLNHENERILQRTLWAIYNHCGLILSSLEDQISAVIHCIPWRHKKSFAASTVEGLSTTWCDAISTCGSTGLANDAVRLFF